MTQADADKSFELLLSRFNALLLDVDTNVDRAALAVFLSHKLNKHVVENLKNIAKGTA